MIVLYCVIALVVFVVYVRWRQSYWTRHGITQMDPEFLIGNARSILFGKKSFAETVVERYNAIKSSNQPLGGVYIFLSPMLYPVDLDLIKNILQKDFSHFTDHGLYHHKQDTLTMNLFNLEGDTWKNLRAKLTPTFTSGKMKMMFETLVEKTEGLEKMVQRFSEKQEGFAIKDVLGRFTTDIIGSCAFGIECNSMDDPDNDFRNYGRKVFEPSLYRFWMLNLMPKTILGYMGFKSNGADVSDFFIRTVKETIRNREEQNIFRKDFMHLLLQLKNDGKVKVTEDEIIAQCFIFFLAGFETSSTAMTFALLELAQNQDIQEKLRSEINEVIDKYEGKVTYDGVMEMRYLDNVINETLRKFSPVAALPRICTKPYKVPNTNFTIEKGTRITIPVWGLHRDPEYYPNPDKFDPDRFSDENKKKIPDCTFLPFGEGPRMCIGLRFGMLQSKVGLISLLRKFKFTLNGKTKIPIDLDRGTFIISVKGELWLDATQINY